MESSSSAQYGQAQPLDPSGGPMKVIDDDDWDEDELLAMEEQIERERCEEPQCEGPQTNARSSGSKAADAANRAQERIVTHLVRNLALLGFENDAAAAESTTDLVLAVCEKRVLHKEGISTVVLALRHWLARCAGRIPDATLETASKRLDEFENACEGDNTEDRASSVSACMDEGADCAPNAGEGDAAEDTAFAVHACAELWARRTQNCVFHFKEERFWSETLSLDDCSCLLQNVDACRMDAVCLLQVVKLLWSSDPAKERLRKFVQHNYEREASRGLRDHATFDKKWEDAEPHESFRNALWQHLHVKLAAHPFVCETIPAILGRGCGVLSFNKRDRELVFKLDDPPASFDADEEEEELALDYATGEITSSTGRGVLCALYDDVRELVRDEGNTVSMSKLVAKRGFGNLAKYDGKEASWRIYDQGCGIWRLPNTECEPHALLSHFASRIFKPVEKLAVFLGEGFNWVTGSFEHGDDAIDDCGAMEDDSASICTAGSSTRKRKRPTMTPAQVSLKKLAGATYRFVESLKHQTEVLKAAQHLLIGNFSDIAPYLLPCVNGIVDLRTGELRPTRPQDLVTRVCQTPYDPAADVGAAKRFYESFLPEEAYPDQHELVTFLSTWMGYSITGETNLET